ncbi:RsiV family protein [Caproiciproducens sp. R1]|uniref:RsiV family protein n=1 Tax=Caproiciproducens sp. R1 TaxID=3435000 RepID=UPI0040340740
MSMSQKDWNDFIVQYEQFHAPRELEERLRQMENEYQKKKHPSPLFLWSRRAAACLCCAVIGLSVAANTSAAAAETLQNIPIIGPITKVVTFRHYQSGDADIRTPHVTGLGDKKVEEKLNQEFDQYADVLIAQYESDIKGMGSSAKEAVTSSYNVLVENDSQLTIAIRTVLVSGDSMEIDRYYNIEKSSGKILKLSDLFKSSSDYAAPINTYISEKIQKSSEDYFTDTDAFQTIAKDQNFYINKSGKLIIVFDEGSIAPAYRGITEFTIPTDLIASILADGSMIH